MAYAFDCKQPRAAPARGPGRTRRLSLTWPRLNAATELGIVAAGYFGYALVRLAVRAGHAAAFGRAAEIWDAERWLHVDIERSLNSVVTADPALAQLAGYYYGLLHFIVTPLTLAWLYLRRPADFPRLRSSLVLTTAGANLVFWTWPVAPPRFAVAGMTDVLSRYHILGADDPRGPDSMVNLYAAMPSLHVAWAVWCAAAIVLATRSRWRHLAWLYPTATTLVVLASANHFVLDAAGGTAITALGLLATRKNAGHAHAPTQQTRRVDVSDPAGPQLSLGPYAAVPAGSLGVPVAPTYRAMAAGTRDGSPDGSTRPQPRSRSP
jgi:PAP2 superfamily